MNEFGLLLKTTREQFGLTQLELSKLSGLTPAAISTFESGRRKPGLRSLLAIRKALKGVSLDWLILGEDTANCTKCCSVKSDLIRIIENI